MAPVNLKDRFEARIQRGQANLDRQDAEFQQQRLARISSLQTLSDEELIAQAENLHGCNQPHHQMEMQRRLKNSVIGLTTQAERARWWAFWGTMVLVVLTVVLVALTVVLALRA